MPFREKVKKAIGRGSSTTTSLSSSTVPSTVPSEEISRVQSPAQYASGTGTPIDREHLTIDPREAPLIHVDSNVTLKKKSTLSKIKSSFKKDDPYKDWPDHIYKPHELPRAKYRRPIDPDHQQTLQSYSLRSAFADMRRKSGVSQYSPMGSRLASRRGSFASRLGRSAAPSRNHSIVEAVDENDVNDSDITNVGQSNSFNNSGAVAPIPMRHRGDTVTTTSTVPDLIQSSSIDSDDTDSFLNTSQAVTLGDVSRTGGVDNNVQNFSKPFDGDELTRALTRKLMASAGQL